MEVPDQYQDAYEHIKKSLENGDDVNKHLSRGIKNLTSNDLMLNEWGIYHFHLHKDMKIYGGFDGTETVLSQRNLAANNIVFSIKVTGYFFIRQLWRTIY